jgi:transcriptional regulator with XRE-family HTH domain
MTPTNDEVADSPRIPVKNADAGSEKPRTAARVEPQNPQDRGSRRRRATEIGVRAATRGGEVRRRIGGELRASRRRRGWAQGQVAERAGIDRQLEGRVERGRSKDLDAIFAVALALDRRPDLLLGRDVDAIEDAAHLAMQELVLRSTRPAGYSRQVELATRPNEPWRSIDVALASRTRRCGVVVECWNTFGNIGASVRSSVRKVAELEALLAGLWGEALPVGLVWVVRATAANRTVIARYPEVFAARFPGSSRAWVEALTRGAAPPSKPGLVWCDVAMSRLFARRG